jgi:integrase
MPLRLKPDPKSGVFYVHGTVASKRIRRSLKTRDKRLAEHMAAEIEGRELRKSIYGPERETTFAEAARLYMLDGGERRYLAPILGKLGPKKKLSDLSGAYVRKIAKELYKDVKPQTWNRYVVKPVSAVLHFAHDAKLGPPIKIKGFRSLPIKKRDAASQAWLAAFVNACDEQGWPYIGSYALFMHINAARPSEAIVLGPEHIDLDRKIGVSEPTKTGDYRYFRLSDELVRRFRLYPPKALQWGKNAGKLRLFGYADTKGPIPIWKEVCKKAGLRYFSPYPAGRKSFATTLISKGKEDLKTTAELGNWKDIRVLLDHYVDPHGIDEIFERNFEGLLARNWQGQNTLESQVVVTERKKAENE